MSEHIAEQSQETIIDPFILAEEAVRELTIASNANGMIDQAKVVELRTKLGHLSVLRAEATLSMNDVRLQEQ